MMNRTMKLLLISDIFVLTGFGLIQPILAIYINDGNVTGGTMITAGMASALFLLTKSLVQLPFGHYVDSQDSKERWLVLGTLLMACVPLIYLSASSIYQVYLAEVVYGLGSGLAYPTWLGLWSVNLDRGRESFEWSIYHTSTGVGAAATGAAGAAVASHVGFSATFLMAGLLCVLGCLVLLALGRRSSQIAEDSWGEARFRRGGMGNFPSRLVGLGPKNVMQRRNALIAGLLAAVVLFVVAAFAQDPISEIRPETGAFIKGGEMNGMCQLDIINNGANDAVAYLSTMEKKIVAAVYIRGDDSFNLTGIDAGSYELYFKQGRSWSNSTGRFAINSTSSRMQEPLIFETQKTPEGIRYTWGQITLKEVPNGNAVAVPVDEKDFPV